MSSRRPEIEPTDEEFQMAESLIDALTVDDPEERQEILGEWRKTNMPAVSELLDLHFNTMLDELIVKMEPQGRRNRESQRIEREAPRFDITIKVTYQGIDGKRMVRESPEPPAASSADDGDDGDWDDYDGDDGGRTANDDRSDSMNPNNDSYQASADNRSDQMNPNNDAYSSSRR